MTIPPPPPPGLMPEAALVLGESVEQQELNEPRIPRPPNSWILYRQAKSRELSGADGQYAGMTASELCKSSFLPCTLSFTNSS